MTPKLTRLLIIHNSNLKLSDPKFNYLALIFISIIND